jgi:hypothetical protein
MLIGGIVMIDLMKYKPKGDKQNSDLFNEYVEKIYYWRQESHLDDLVKRIRAFVIQVESGNAFDYINELYMMTPYRFTSAYQNETHNIYILNNIHEQNERPCYLILEPLNADYEDEITQFDKLYPIGMNKSNARYIGEIFQVKNVLKTRNVLESHDIRFHENAEGKNQVYNNKHFIFTTPSPYTFNRFGYTHSDLLDFDNLHIGRRIKLPKDVQAKLSVTDNLYKKYGLDGIIDGVDHVATRVLSSNREAAILEFLTCSNYYFWGAYNIKEANSSTNVTRNPKVRDECLSPAKVFTANNTPYFVNAFNGSPMPTENFVRNLGPRMHHMAMKICDGEHSGGQKNIDYTVDVIKKYGVRFLAHIVGDCGDEPDLKQIFSKRSKYSMLITEYVQRCKGFQGFFTKDNVAALTNAAGNEEMINHGKVFD